MAGLGRKTFIATEVLTAANVNGYLMDQSVMKFASSAARSSAIGTAVSEGMVSYLADTDALEVYNGSSWGAVSSSSSGNAIINGGFDIWQRGTSAAGSYPTYLADRWMNYRSTTGSTFSRQATGDTTNLPDIQYAVRMQRDSGNTSTNAIYSSQSLETSMSRQFSGKTVTLSWYARAGANFSATSSLMNFELVYGTGTDQNVIAGFTGQTNAISSTKTLTTTWQRFTATGSIPGTATQVATNFYFSPVGTAGAADYIEITGVQLETGSNATAFKRNGPSIQAELAACQRYYQRVTATTAFSNLTGTGSARNSTGGFFMFPLKVSLRAQPTATDALSVAFDDGASSLVAATSVSHAGVSPDCVVLLATAASGLTQFRPYSLIASNNAAAFIGISAEL